MRPAFMILPQLIRLHLDYEKNAHAFFELQARDALDWLQAGGVQIGSETRMLDLGCGHGYPGQLCREAGAQVVFADFEDLRLDSLKEAPFRQIDLNQADLADYGRHDLVKCSNVLEHLAEPDHLLRHLDQLLNPGGLFYLSWTNWLSPWGGHEFSPWHYLGKRSGPIHTVGKNLFKTYIGEVLHILRAQKKMFSGIKFRFSSPRFPISFKHRTRKIFIFSIKIAKSVPFVSVFGFSFDFPHFFYKYAIKMVKI